MTCSLTSLPVEIFEQITCFLPTATLLSCSRTSKTLSFVSQRRLFHFVDLTVDTEPVSHYKNLVRFAICILENPLLADYVRGLALALTVGEGVVMPLQNKRTWDYYPESIVSIFRKSIFPELEVLSFTNISSLPLRGDLLPKLKRLELWNSTGFSGPTAMPQIIDLEPRNSLVLLLGDCEHPGDSLQRSIQAYCASRCCGVSKVILKRPRKGALNGAFLHSFSHRFGETLKSIDIDIALWVEIQDLWDAIGTTEDGDPLIRFNDQLESQMLNFSKLPRLEELSLSLPYYSGNFTSLVYLSPFFHALARAFSRSEPPPILRTIDFFIQPPLWPIMGATISEAVPWMTLDDTLIDRNILPKIQSISFCISEPTADCFLQELLTIFVRSRELGIVHSNIVMSESPLLSLVIQ
ncbi:hypothetical protein DL96DRAFT_1285567 [Flagelloscypha sp. PMI_526]|nr:hypothetical protein DL96DRAFT_1285567 [Flagelloscypha sp. PMI_526]